ncbi:Ivy family c-type lysozyme inhibitor [Frateuria aurantia]
MRSFVGGLLSWAWLGAMGTAVAQPPEYLHQAQQRPAFAEAYQRVIRADGLPGWIARGGTETPATAAAPGQGGDLIYASCKPHDCATEQMLIYYSAASGQITGLFVRHLPGQVPSRLFLQWLGKPDAIQQQALLRRLVPD